MLSLLRKAFSKMRSQQNRRMSHSHRHHQQSAQKKIATPSGHSPSIPTISQVQAKTADSVKQESSPSTVPVTATGPGNQMKTIGLRRCRVRPLPPLEPLKGGHRIEPSERMFLEAAERGDKQTVLRCLVGLRPVNVNCTNILGRSAIQVNFNVLSLIMMYTRLYSKYLSSSIKSIDNFSLIRFAFDLDT
jgi:hypothetical protein